MTLPKLNESLSFTIEIPSLNKKVKARPYLVKEEKELLFAAESRNTEMILAAMAKTINNCVELPNGVSANDLTTFDIEYVFVQLRSISVGETSKIRSNCEACQAVNDNVEVNFKAVKFDKRETYSPIINLTPSIKIELGYPRIKDLADSGLAKLTNGTDEEDKISTENLFNVIRMTIRKVITDNEQFVFGEYSIKEQEEFIGQFNNAQLGKIIAFIQDIPSASIDIEYECQACKHQNKLNLKGMQNFFS